MTIRENLLELRHAIAAWPEEKFDLEFVAIKHDCGTLYCALGIVGSTPCFQVMGYSLDMFGRLTKNGDFYLADLDDDFGHHAYGHIFQQRQRGGFDSLITKDSKEALDDTVTDKMLALARIDKQLELYL